MFAWFFWLTLIMREKFEQDMKKKSWCQRSEYEGLIEVTLFPVWEDTIVYRSDLENDVVSAKKQGRTAVEKASSSFWETISRISLKRIHHLNLEIASVRHYSISKIPYSQRLW